VGRWSNGRVNAVNGVANTTIQYPADGKGAVTTTLGNSAIRGWKYGVITGMAINTITVGREVSIMSEDDSRVLARVYINPGNFPRFLPLCIPIYEPWGVKADGASYSLGITYEMEDQAA